MKTIKLCFRGSGIVLHEAASMSNVSDWRESGIHFSDIVVPTSGKGVVKQVFLLNLPLKYAMIMPEEDSNPGPSVQTWRSRRP